MTGRDADKEVNAVFREDLSKNFSFFTLDLPGNGRGGEESSGLDFFVTFFIKKKS